MTFERFLEHHAHHLKASAAQHTSMAEEEEGIAKVHDARAERHTDQILAQDDRDFAGRHRAKAQHHRARAKHYLDQHEKLAPASDATLVDEHSDAGDSLREAAHTDFMKRVCGVEV